MVLNLSLVCFFFFSFRRNADTFECPLYTFARFSRIRRVVSSRSWLIELSRRLRKHTIIVRCIKILYYCATCFLICHAHTCIFIVILSFPSFFYHLIKTFSAYFDLSGLTKLYVHFLPNANSFHKIPNELPHIKNIFFIY